MHPYRARLFLVLTLALPLSLGACRSASDHGDEADREVYRILDEVRDKLAGEEAYRVERAPDRLRERLLAQDGTAEPMPPLKLAEVLSIAAENSRDFQTRRETLYLQALDLTLQRWNFSVQELGVLAAFVEGDGDGAQTAGGNGNLAISKLFETGARVLGSIGIQLVRDVTTGDAWGAFTTLSFSVTQPLLRGFGSDVVREPLTQAERDVLYEARAFERFRRTFAFDVANRYFRVLEQMDTLHNEEVNLENLTVLRQRNEAFGEAGQMSDIEVDQARQNELRAEDSVVSARRSVEESLDLLKLFIGLPVETPLELDPSELEQLESFAQGIEDLPEDRAIALALRERLDHANVLDQVDDAERRVGVLADALRAGLDLIVAGTGTSDENQLDFGDNTSWTASAVVDLPLDRLPERNAYRAGLIALEVARRGAEESGDTVRAQLREARRVLIAARASYDIQRGAVTLAERRVESAELSLEAGRVSTRDVLEAHEDLVSARNAATSARIDKFLAQLAFYRDLEVLLVRPEGLSVDQERLQMTEPEPEPQPEAQEARP